MQKDQEEVGLQGNNQRREGGRFPQERGQVKGHRPETHTAEYLQVLLVAVNVTTFDKVVNMITDQGASVKIHISNIIIYMRQDLGQDG